MKKKQKLVTVHVTTTPAPGEPSIVPVDGAVSLETLLGVWRVVQIQPLGLAQIKPLGQGPDETTYVALLLLEESQEETGLGRLGFGHE